MLRHAAILACIPLLSGCFLDLLGATAVTSTLAKRQVETGQRAMDMAKGTAGRVQLEQAIQSYHADRGYWPSNLQALVPTYLQTIPARADGQPFGYDPMTGRLLDASITGPTQLDAQRQQQILQAINAYGTATGWYPPTLEALVPQYLPAVPYTESGQAFLYNPQNGAVQHPLAHMPPHTVGGAGSGGGAGAGPMGEALTGMQMQQQLQNMNQSGASSAGTRARQNIQQQRGSENERTQDRLLEDLGV